MSTEAHTRVEIELELAEGFYQEIMRAATAENMSLDAFVNQAVREYLQRMK
ncbi:MAG: hypothetical protein IKA23_03770 [Akkermansia sp.]|nr:hypothetical protein [Akkermansia sp.]